MQAQYTTAKKITLFFVAAPLLAAPVHAQTLKASSTQITIGRVIGCNDSRHITLTSTSTAIALNAAITYQSGDVHGSWLYVRDMSTGNTTSSSTAVHSTVPATPSNGLDLKIGLNLANLGAGNDKASLVLTTTSPAGQSITINVAYKGDLNCAGVTSDNGTISAEPGGLVLTGLAGQQPNAYVLVAYS